MVNQRLDILVNFFRQQTDIEFYIEDDVRDRQVSAEFRNLPIGFGIKKLLEGTGINHAVIGNADGIHAIFIGSSQEPQPSFRKVDNSATLFPRRRSNSQNFQVLRPARPTKNAPNSKKAQPQIKPAVRIPTGGALTTNKQTSILVPKPIGDTGQQDKKK